MTESREWPLSGWRTGMHPHAANMRIRSLGRVHLQLGEALRLEMMDEGPGASDIVHLQYYIATELGPWALWVSCTRAEAAGLETTLRDVVPPFAESPQS